jgi:hypothetical protein
MEVIDIDLDTIPVSAPSSSSAGSSVNFGSGIELLMNEKKKSSSTSTKMNLDDLDNLERELNDLSTPTATSSTDTKNLSGLSGFANMFNFSGTKEVDPKLGQATQETNNQTKTWDGFTKVGEEIPRTEPRASANMPEREKRRRKRMMIKKLEEWQEKGLIKNSSPFTMDSAYDEVEDEYEGALEDKRKKDSIKLQGWWFTTVVNTLEYGNALLNPFDLNLDGWGEQVSEDLDSYEEIFAELHEKYKGGKMAPEVSLLLRIGFSAAVVNMSNKMLSSATPGVGDMMKQSPELMRMFTNVAVDTMSKQNSAFDFAKTMMNPPEQVNTRMGPPPAPVETKSQAPPQRPGNRPDLNAASGSGFISGAMFRESGVDLQQKTPLNSNLMTNTIPNSFAPPRPEPQRPEMKGPQNTDIEQLLSGLKKKSVEEEIPMDVMNTVPSGNNSMISLSSLKDLENVQMPKKTNRRGRQNKSDKNTVSLDI